MLSYVDGQCLVTWNSGTETISDMGTDEITRTYDGRPCVVKDRTVIVDSTVLGRLEPGYRIAGFSPDGTEFLVIDDSTDDVTQVRCINNGGVVLEFHGLNSTSGVYSPDGLWIVIASYTGLFIVNNRTLKTNRVFNGFPTTGIEFNELGITVLVLRPRDDGGALSSVHCVNPKTLETRELVPDSLLLSYTRLSDGRLCLVELINQNSTQSRVRIVNGTNETVLEDTPDALSVVSSHTEFAVVCSSPRIVVYTNDVVGVCSIKTRRIPTHVRLN